MGSAYLETLLDTPELAHVPLVVFSFSVRRDELPNAWFQRRPNLAFLAFPEGLQELNPLISGFLGPAEGSTNDLRRLRHELDHPPPPSSPNP